MNPSTPPLRLLPVINRKLRPVLTAAFVLGQAIAVLSVFAEFVSWRANPSFSLLLPTMLAIGVLLTTIAAALRWRMHRDADGHAQLLLDLPGSPVIGVDADGCVTFASAGMRDLLDMTSSEIQGQDVLTLLRPELDGVAAKSVTDWSSASELTLEIGSRRFAADAAVTVVARPLTETEFMVSVIDDTVRRNYESRLERLALNDALTGLANRTNLDEQLRQGLARLERAPRLLGVLYADLDRFKAVNDSLGHEVGDKLLIEVANRIREQVRAGDVVGRIGGDEFVVICPELDGAHEASIIAERIIEAVCRPVLIDGNEVSVGISVGIRITDDHRTPPNELLRDADAALYASKTTGGASTVYDDSLARTAVDRFELEQDLRKAIKNGEIDVHYQPHVRLDDGRVTGFEALARWTHPVHGNISPARFIPVAEEAGLIGDLGANVLGTAMIQLERWHLDRPDLELQMSVNVSALQLRDRHFVPLVASLLGDVAFAPKQLVIELTESVLIESVKGGDEALRRLDRLGVRIAIDDFGTGYSSLAMLRTMPVDIVKIDRAFVTPMAGDPTQRKLVGAIIAMTHALGKESIAEGVESDAERGILSELGCDRYQGFLHTRPASASDVGHLVHNAPRVEEDASNVVSLRPRMQVG